MKWITLHIKDGYIHICFDHLGGFGSKAKLIMSHLRQSNDAKKRTRKLRSIAIPQLGLPLRCDIQIGVDFSTNSLIESYDNRKQANLTAISAKLRDILNRRKYRH